MYVQEFRNANTSFCVPVEEKQNLKNSKHILPAPTFGINNFFSLSFFFNFLFLPLARLRINM